MEDNHSTPFMSDDIRLIAQGILKAKKGFKPTGLSGKNSHQKYKYAKLVDIYGAVEDALSHQGILIIHMRRKSNTSEYLHTRLIHAESGQWIEDLAKIDTEKAGNQAKGAALTYMRKYAVLNLCAIASEDDDDCEVEEKYIAKRQAIPKIDNNKLQELQEAIKSCQNSKVVYSNILKFNKVKDLRELREDQYETIISYVYDIKMKEL